MSANKASTLDMAVVTDLMMAHYRVLKNFTSDEIALIESSLITTARTDNIMVQLYKKHKEDHLALAASFLVWGYLSGRVAQMHLSSGTIDELVNLCEELYQVGVEEGNLDEVFDKVDKVTSSHRFYVPSEMEDSIVKEVEELAKAAEELDSNPLREELP